jgi:hypothetical protein
MTYLSWLCCPKNKRREISPFGYAANPAAQLGLPSKFCSGKIPWNRLGTVFAIPREKVLLSRNSVCLEIAHFEVWNGTEFLQKNEV